MLAYATRPTSKQLVHIRAAGKGKESIYSCPHCCTRLIPHQGKQVVWHYKHASGEECQGAVETALHQRAKEILLKEQSIKLPILHVKGQAHSYQYGLTEHESHLLINSNTSFTLDTIRFCEKNINTFRPDLLLYHQGSPLLVEIAVTHFVDTIKQRKIADSGMSAIEIDLSEYKDKELSDDELRRLLITDNALKSWIYNAKEEDCRLRCETIAKQKLKSAIHRKVTEARDQISFYFDKIRRVEITQVERHEKKDSTHFSATLRLESDNPYMEAYITSQIHWVSYMLEPELVLIDNVELYTENDSGNWLCITSPAITEVIDTLPLIKKPVCSALKNINYQHIA